MLGLSGQIWSFAAPLYMEELNYVREGCKSDIRYEGIKKVSYKFQASVARFFTLLMKIYDTNGAWSSFFFQALT